MSQMSTHGGGRAGGDGGSYQGGSDGLDAVALVEEGMDLRQGCTKDAVVACEERLLKVAEERIVSVGAWSNRLRV